MPRILVRTFTVPTEAMDVNGHVSNLEYLFPAFAGDSVAVLTWVADLRPRSSTRRYLIWRARDHRVLARAETLWVFVDVDTGRARAIPEELRSSFELVPDRDEALRALESGDLEPFASGRAAGPRVPRETA